ncbi:GGDEF domain-containing protein [Amycolatopsis sp. H20-H5]|uniref:GGDEF domain-containing protein n=1 Tax=Amycolatopsis sp. H20-H5 TaxID=3046309 RepID=UPI002DB6B0BE|nr:GGDEF domain-containing protein [Amycolatopsis sp. H20-H5]MEC3982505.1 GGDEF domain-containing protein [Amycolatopsis sp. H20-H5]
MNGADAAASAPARLHAALSPLRWTLWKQRPTLILYCLLVETVALAVTAATAIGVPTRLRDLVFLAVLACLGVLQAELGRQVERVRRLVSDTPHINMTSVWTFAGVLLLPPALVGTLVAILYLHLATRSLYRIRRVPPFRTVLNATLVIVTCYATDFVLARTGITSMYAALGTGWAGVGAIVLAVVTYFVVAAVTILPALTLTNRSFAALFGGAGDNLLEVATLCLGILTALALATLPALALAIVPPLLILHRAVLVKQLEIAATTDEKTGLFNTTGWHTLATRELSRAQRLPQATFGVLMVDLDHFKRINDRHGHLGGDTVLKAVATTLRDAVRDYDSVGRFGGEEFVVLLPDIREIDVLTVAERIREAIAGLTVRITDGESAKLIDGLSASIGVATYPDAGAALDRLLQAADKALYSAKSSGRNKVVSIMDVA